MNIKILFIVEFDLTNYQTRFSHGLTLKSQKLKKQDKKNSLFLISLLIYYKSKVMYIFKALVPEQR